MDADLANLDDWLERLLPPIGRSGALVLELGCGLGEDAATLASYGLNVVAFDRVVRRLARAKDAAPKAHLFVGDLARPLPFRDGVFAGAVASLSMHYLPWTATITAFTEVRRVLSQGAWFAFRVNAFDDVNFGAGQGVELEPGYFQAERADSETFKRFFDEEMVRDALRGSFTPISLRHGWISRWGKPKRVWECLATAI